MAFQTVQCASSNQTLDHAPVDCAQVDALAELEEGRKRAFGNPRIDYALRRTLADVLDRRQSVANALVRRRKIERTLVDVRRQGGNAHAAAVVEQDGQPVRIFALKSQAGGHIFLGIMGFEVSIFVRTFGIADRVRLVEGVAGKNFDLAEELVGQCLFHPVCSAAADEVLFDLGHFLGLLLAHRLAQNIGLAEGETGQLLGDAHDLLLIDHNPIGRLQNRLQLGVIVGDGLFAVLAGDEGRDIVHRPRTIEGVHGDNVFDGVRLELDQVFAHPCGLKLENADRLAAAEQVERGPIVPRNGFQIKVRLLESNQAHGLLDQRELLQAQDVHLQQADVHAGLADELGSYSPVFGGAIEWHVVGQFAGSDDDRAGVDRGVTRHALQLAGVFDQLAFVAGRLGHLL